MVFKYVVINRNVIQFEREDCVELILNDRKVSLKLSHALYRVILRVIKEGISIKDLNLEINSVAFETISLLMFYDILIEENADLMLANGILCNAARLSMEACPIPDKNISEWCFFGAPVDFALDPPRSPAHGPYVYRKFSHSHKRMVDLGDVVYTTADNIYSFGEKIKHIISKIKNYNNNVIMIGGDHSLTYFSFTEIKKYIPEVVLIQFDAHSDINTSNDRINTSLYHANFVSKLLVDSGPSTIVQIGVREKTKRYTDNYLEDSSIVQFPVLMNSSDKLYFQELIRGKPVYISFDVDVIDPSLFPHVTTPLEHGMNISEIKDIVNIIKSSQCTVTGIDVMEFTCGFDEKGRAFNHECHMLDAVIEAIIN